MRLSGYTIVLLMIVVLVPTVAHKTPLIEYHPFGGGMMEVGVTFTPRQPVVNEKITIYVTASHPGDVLEGKVDTVISVYKDNSVNEWYKGQPYKTPDYTIIKTAKGEPIGEYEFKTDVVVDQPGNYLLTVDVYLDGQYMGQSMGGIDVETRTLGPLFLTFSALILIGVLWGVKKGIL